MTVIELGELRGDPDPGPRPRRRRPVGRPYLLLGVLLAALPALAGAVPPAGRVTVTVPGGPGAEPFLLGDRLYVVEPADPDRGGGRELVAYRRPARGQPTVLWRTPLPAGGTDPGLWERDGTLLLSGRGASDTGYRTSTVDARTGRIGWQQPGIAVPAGDALLVQTVDGEGTATLRRVDPVTGATRWTVPTGSRAVDLRFGAAGVDRIVLADPAGPVEVRDPASGAPLVARNVRPGELPSYQRTLVAGELLLVIRAGGAEVTAYDLDRLERRWTAALPLLAYAHRCAALLCAYRQTGGMWAVDPATGVTRWSDPRWQAVLADAGGRLLVAGVVGGGPAQAVLDAASGRVLAELRGWDVIRRDDPAGPVVAVRPGRDGRLLVADWDLATARARVRDALPGVLGDCRIGGDALLCRLTGGGFGLWELR